VLETDIAIDASVLFDPETLHSDQLEVMVLSAAMQDEAASRWFANNMPVEAFFKPAHRTIANEIRETVRQNLHPSCEALGTILEHKGLLTGIGGSEYLWQIALNMPSSASIRYHGHIVLDHATRRILASRGRALDDFCRRGDKSLPEIMRKLFAIGHRLPAVNTGLAFGGETGWEEIFRENQGIKSQWPTLNSASLAKGYYRGEMNILMAETGIGKTAELAAAFWKAVESGHKPCIVTLELKASIFDTRLVRSITGLAEPPSNLEPLADWNEAWDRLKGIAPTYYCATRAGGDRSIESVSRFVRDAVEFNGCDMALLDYAQLLTTNQRFKEGREAQEYCANQLMDLSKETNAVMLVASAPSINPTNRNIWHTAETQKWEKNAAMVVQIRRKNNEREGRIVVSKNRHGQPTSFEVGFNGAKVRHEESSDPYAEP
jgi:replicative DNA helicase